MQTFRLATPLTAMADETHATLLVTNLVGAASVIALTFGVKPARERAMRFLRQAYRNYVGTGGLLPSATFFDMCLTIPGLNDPAHVWFSFWEGLCLHYTVPYWIDVMNLTTGQIESVRYYLLAVNSFRPDLIIPSRLWIPYESTQRSEPELERTWMLPTYFMGSDGSVGVRLAASAQELIHLSDVPTGFERQTVYVHLHVSMRTSLC